METPDEDCVVHSIEYLFRILNNISREGVFHRVEAEQEVEQMFSLLNKRFGAGNHLARLCKFLNFLPQFFPGFGMHFLNASYLVEDGRLRRGDSGVSGHRIAFLIRQLVLVQIRSRKD
jgi:hypothetical protein